MKTLQSTLAGAWYPGTEREIRAAAEKWENFNVKDEVAAPAAPNVIILPHAGWDYSGRTAWRAVRLIRDAKFRRAVILAPSHRAWIENHLVAPESDAVSTPLGQIKIDKDWLNSLELLAPVQRNDRIHMAEHSAQIEFPLLQLALEKDFTVVPLIMGSFGPDQMGMCARALSKLMDAETLLVISSDFTHYGADFEYAPYGTKGGDEVRERVASVDAEAFALFAKGDADGFASYVERTGATICGRIPLEMALRAMVGTAPRAVRPADAPGARPYQPAASLVRLRYATSADEDRDFTRFVCYTAAAGRVEWKKSGDEVLDAEARAFLLRVARESLEHGVRTGRTFPRGHFTQDAPKATLLKMGAFVTLNDKTTGALRGCIGEILPMRPLVEAVAERAVDSALHDPRFMPVEESELGNLSVEVSALTPPKPVASWRDIVLGRDGMTLEKGNAFAVFLPQVAPEQGWDLPTTLTYLSQKAGLPSNAWRNGASFETFQAEVFHE